MREIIVGSVVRLNSGSPRLTVSGTVNLGNNEIIANVEWFDEATLMRDAFDINCLKLDEEIYGATKTPDSQLSIKWEKTAEERKENEG